MNKLDSNILSIISANLSDESINELRMVSAALSHNILKIKSDTLFWKERTELLIGKYITMEGDVSFNWKQIYKILLRYIGTGPPYENLPTFEEKDCIDAQKILKKYGHNRPDTDENIIKAIDEEDYNLMDELLRTKPPIYNNSAFIHAKSMGLFEDEITIFLDYNRVDILTMDQTLLFETITDIDFEYLYNSDIMLAVLEKLDVDEDFIGDTLDWSLRYGNYHIINYLIEEKNINISIFYPDRLVEMLVDSHRFSHDETTDIISNILRKFDTNQNFNNQAFLYFIQNIDKNKNIIDCLLDFNKINCSTINQIKLFELLSKDKAGVEILPKILKKCTVKFSNIYYILDDNTSKEFIEILLHYSIFDPRSVIKLPKYLTKLTTEMMSLLKKILQKYNTSNNFNNEAFLHYLSYGNIDMADWVFDHKDMNILNIDTEKLFNLLSKNDATYLLVKILKNQSKFNEYMVYQYLDPAASSEFIEILLYDPRFDPSSLKIVPNFLTQNNADIFLSDPRVNITASYFKYKTAVMRDYIKNSLSGLVVMHYLYGGGVNIYLAPRTASEIDKFYYRFLRFLVSKKPKIINAIGWLTTTIKSLDKNIIYIIPKAADSVLNNITHSYSSKSNRNVYNAFRAFFLLAYQPRYTYKEILKILELEDVDNIAVGMAAKIVGAMLGLDALIKDGLILTKNLQEHIQREKFKDLSNLDYTEPELIYRKPKRYMEINK
jgi:hypothetical protein